jgi:nucleotide-binding universal stress UspA family protein
MQVTRILLAVDGSESARHAVAWCAQHARLLGASVVAVHAVEGPDYDAPSSPFLVPPVSDSRVEELRSHVRQEWCGELVGAGVLSEVTVVQGPAAKVVEELAASGDFDLVVVGRRGHGAIARVLLGSTSSALAHRLGRPLVIVP